MAIPNAVTISITSRWPGPAPTTNGPICTDARTAIIATIVLVGKDIDGVIGEGNMGKK